MTTVSQALAVPTILATLAQMDAVKFARVTYRAKGTGELAIHTMLVNFNMDSLYKEDVETVEALHDAYSKAYNANPDDDAAKVKMLAAGQILASLKESLALGIGNNSKYTHGPHAGDTYVHLHGIKNVKAHKASGIVYVYGRPISKTVLEEGEYKTVKHSPLTLAKNDIRAQLQTGNLRQFIVEHVRKVQCDGDTIIVEENDDAKKADMVSKGKGKAK